MLAGAFVGVAVGNMYLLGSNGCSLGVGALLDCFTAYLTQSWAHHIVSGLAINLLVAGAHAPLCSPIPSGVQTDGLPKPLFLLILAASNPLAAALLARPYPFGLRLRAVGEDPKALAW
jgi:ABC-type uncharacterized transport system permease subunit